MGLITPINSVIALKDNG